MRKKLTDKLLCSVIVALTLIVFMCFGSVFMYGYRTITQLSARIGEPAIVIKDLPDGKKGWLDSYGCVQQEDKSIKARYGESQVMLLYGAEVKYYKNDKERNQIIETYHLDPENVLTSHF